MSILSRPISRSLGLFLLLLCSSGCLNYQEQTIVLFFPKDGKEIQGLIIYEGLGVFGGPKKPPNDADFQNAAECLKAGVRGDIISIFGSPLPLKPLWNQDGQPFPDVLTYLTAHKGQFLVSKDGRLTYCQPVTVRDPHKFIAAANKEISTFILDKAQIGTTARHHEVLKKFAMKGHPWIQFDKGRVAASVPGDPAIFQQLRNQFFEFLGLPGVDTRDLQFLTSPKADAEYRKRLAAEIQIGANYNQRLRVALAKIPMSVDQRRDMLTVSLGYGDNEPFVVRISDLVRVLDPVIPIHDHLPAYSQELTKHAKTLGVPVRMDLTVASVVAEFQRTGQLPKLQE